MSNPVNFVTISLQRLSGVWKRECEISQRFWWALRHASRIVSLSHATFALLKHVFRHAFPESAIFAKKQANYRPAGVREPPRSDLKTYFKSSRLCASVSGAVPGFGFGGAPQVCGASLPKQRLCDPMCAGVCEEVYMSVRSKLEAAGRGSYGDTVDRLRAGASRMKAERARERHDAANAQKAEALHHPPKETPTLEAWPLPGLSPMTRVRTNFGDVHAAALRRGDEVLTRNGTYQAIQWLTRIRLDEELLKEKPDCNPVIIAAGALAPQIPAQDISVSPRQIIVADGSTTLMQSIEAAKLCTRPGIRRLRETSLSYTMFHVGEAAEVYVEGMYLTFPMDA